MSNFIFAGQVFEANVGEVVVYQYNDTDNDWILLEAVDVENSSTIKTYMGDSVTMYHLMEACMIGSPTENLIRLMECMVD